MLTVVTRPSHAPHALFTPSTAARRALNGHRDPIRLSCSMCHCRLVTSLLGSLVASVSGLEFGPLNRKLGARNRPSVDRRVFVVGEVFAPFCVAFGEREVDHESVGGGAVPVPFVGLGDDDVAGAEPDERPAARLDESFAFGAVERLAAAVAVPGGVGARREVDAAESDGRRPLAAGDCVDVDVAGEPFGGSTRGWGPGLSFHVSPSTHRGMLHSHHRPGGPAAGVAVDRGTSSLSLSEPATRTLAG